MSSAQSLTTQIAIHVPLESAYKLKMKHINAKVDPHRRTLQFSVKGTFPTFLEFLDRESENRTFPVFKIQ